MELNRSANLPGYDIVGHCRRETVGLLPSAAPESNNGRMFAKVFGVEVFWQRWTTAVPPTWKLGHDPLSLL